MRFTRDFRDVLKPTSLGIFIFISLSLAFVVGFAFSEYQRYVVVYQNEQKEELTTLQQKTTEMLENLKKLSQLTNVRIEAAHGEIRRIENILSSVPRLFPDYEFPRIKDVAYHKLSYPQMTISCFGTLPLHPKHIPLERPSTKETLILFEKDNIVGKAFIFNENEKLEGLLEIHLPLPAFRAFLRSFGTLAFVAAFPSQKVLQSSPFSIYANAPDDFWKFLSLNISRYAIFLCYLSFAVIFFVFFASYLRQRSEGAAQNKVEALETALLKSDNEKEDFKSILLNYQQTSLVQQHKHKSHQFSFESYKDLHANVIKRQKEQVDHILQTLNSVKQAATNAKNQLQEIDGTNIIDACAQAVQLLPSGRISRLKTEPINLKKLIEEIQSLFAERIYKYNVLVEAIYPENLFFKGDFLYTKIILITLFAKAIYRISKDEKIVIKIKNHNEFLRIEILDNGYSLNNKENLKKKSLAFVIEDEVFDRMCKEQGLFYKYSKAKDGSNIAKLTIPAPLPEVSGNVIPLFQ